MPFGRSVVYIKLNFAGKAMILMNLKKKFKQKKDPYPINSPVRVKNSYYTFSKEYPAAKVIKIKHTKSKKERAHTFLRAVLGVFCFLLIVCVSFFAVNLGLKFSNKPMLPDNADFSTDGEKSGESLFGSDSMRALYMPYELLSNRKKLSSFIKEIERKDCNSVVIDFKTENGKLVYSSQTNLAKQGKCAVFNNETVKEALRIFDANDVNIVARFFCFEDEIASITEPSYAVKYKDTQVLWHENIAEGTGRTWLNPYSSGAVNYLLDLLKEISSMGVSGFILESASFPKGDLSTAGFPGEKGENTRAKALLSFIEKARKTVPESCFLLLSMDADSISGEKSAISYADSLLRSEADGLCLNTAIRPEGYVVDRRSSYASMLSLFSQFRQKQKENAVFAARISMDEYSRKYIRTLQRSGYESFVLFDERGNY